MRDRACFILLKYFHVLVLVNMCLCVFPPTCAKMQWVCVLCLFPLPLDPANPLCCFHRFLPPIGCFSALFYDTHSSTVLPWCPCAVTTLLHGSWQEGRMLSVIRAYPSLLGPERGGGRGKKEGWQFDISTAHQLCNCWHTYGATQGCKVVWGSEWGNMG